MDLYERLEGIFRRVFGDDSIQLTPETTSDDVPGWDSITYITLMVNVEQEFGIQFSSTELGSFQNVGALIESLEKKLGNSISVR